MLFYCTFFLSLLFDYSSKQIISNNFNEKINILWDYLSINLVFNSWIAFSFPINWNLLKILTVIIIFFIFFYYLKYEKTTKIKSVTNNIELSTGENLDILSKIRILYSKYSGKFMDIWYWLILGWAVGNWIERILYSKVTDFISVKYFAIFNFGDIFINIWTIILIIYYFNYDRRSKY